MKSAPQAPQAPDYAGAAQAQGSANIDAARVQGKLNNPNITNPYGQRFVKFDGDEVGIREVLNPESQAIFDQQQKMRLEMAGLGNSALGTVKNVMGAPFEFGGPQVQTSIDNPALQQSVNNPNVNRSLDTSGVAQMPVNAGTTGQEAIMARLRPEMDRRRQALHTQMLNEGHVRGNEGYDRGMQQNSQAENDAMSQAALHGIGLDMGANQQGYNQALQSGQFGNQATAQQFGQNVQAGQFGNQASGQQFNQGLQAGQFGNTSQQQMLAQALMERARPLNEVTALMSGSQIQNPQFQGYQGGNVAAPNVAGAAGQQAQWNQNLYNAGVGQANAGNANMTALGSAALTAFSDRRLKSNIERIGTHPLGIGVYEYDIFGRRERGVMADEVARVLPAAVTQHDSGYLMVNYALL